MNYEGTTAKWPVEWTLYLVIPITNRDKKMFHVKCGPYNNLDMIVTRCCPERSGICTIQRRRQKTFHVNQTIILTWMWEDVVPKRFGICSIQQRRMKEKKYSRSWLHRFNINNSMWNSIGLHSVQGMSIYRVNTANNYRLLRIYYRITTL